MVKDRPIVVSHAGPVEFQRLDASDLTSIRILRRVYGTGKGTGQAALKIRIQAGSGAAAASLNDTSCVPSTGCFPRSVTVPDCSLARIQIAPVPPIRANGLSPIISAGPSSSKMIGSLA